MYDSRNITVPANTTDASPLKTTYDLPDGRITRVEVQFPRGCAGLVHVRIRQGIAQLWPRDPGHDFRSDDRAISWAEDYPVETGRELFDVLISNLDTVYQHVITVAFEITEKPFTPPITPTPNKLQQVRTALGL